jgi:hypothetical protein
MNGFFNSRGAAADLIDTFGDRLLEREPRAKFACVCMSLLLLRLTLLLLIITFFGRHSRLLLTTLACVRATFFTLSPRTNFNYGDVTAAALFVWAAQSKHCCNQNSSIGA